MSLFSQTVREPFFPRPRTASISKHIRWIMNQYLHFMANKIQTKKKKPWKQWLGKKSMTIFPMNNYSWFNIFHYNNEKRTLCMYSNCPNLTSEKTYGSKERSLHMFSEVQHHFQSLRSESQVWAALTLICCKLPHARGTHLLQPRAK